MVLSLSPNTICEKLSRLVQSKRSSSSREGNTRDGISLILLLPITLKILSSPRNPLTTGGKLSRL
ncbi:hypothetical protein MtrunA17_Chr6g0482361 [Medicago truncatula]|uniref:Uncharacterized protein n=1 Tax=Medicago truncatula TaxID=3880 RepID=A0A396HH77_MEDTR|nr:hypothetical protein MtrunA17_Chr6g0482361 [Medicago truncatula]